MNPIEKVIQRLGGLNATARLLGVSTRAVASWRDAGKMPASEIPPPPTKYCRALAEAAAKLDPKADAAVIEKELLATVKRHPKR